MFKVSRSKHDFERTVQMVRENALRVGWDVPWRFELQQHYWDKGLLRTLSGLSCIILCNIIADALLTLPRVRVAFRLQRPYKAASPLRTAGVGGLDARLRLGGRSRRLATGRFLMEMRDGEAAGSVLPLRQS